MTAAIHPDAHGTAPLPRVVSLLPAATEIVAALGAAGALVGVTHECDYPREVVAGLPRVTWSAIPAHAPVGDEPAPARSTPVPSTPSCARRSPPARRSSRSTRQRSPRSRPTCC
jgi:hypothetical protein